MFKDNVDYEVRIPITDEIMLEGMLQIPKESHKFVIFVHGSGSSRLSPRNMFVAKHLQKHGIGTLLIDLLTEREDEIYSHRFDIDLLTSRVIAITQWLDKELEEKQYNLGYFGASTGAAAALKAAAQLRHVVKAIVSRGGRPDLALGFLASVTAPTLLIVGGDDTEVIELNKEAYKYLESKKELEIVPGATHLFEEPGTLEKVAELAGEWFEKYL